MKNKFKIGDLVVNTSSSLFDKEDEIYFIICKIPDKVSSFYRTKCIYVNPCSIHVDEDIKKENYWYLDINEMKLVS